MFCPTCGKDNSQERKFCVTCGTNLEAVSQALSGSREDFFTKINAGFDQLIARYAERVFKSAPSTAVDRDLSKSWQVLGQGVLTSLVDLILFSLMWNIFPLRFLILVISTPIKLLSERSSREKSPAAGPEGQTPLRLTEPPARERLPGAATSVSEHTTERLQEYQPPRRSQNSQADEST